MGLLNKIKTHRCYSFTLIESVVAIIVIMICFWLSTMIYINILRSDARLPRLKAFIEMKRIAIETNQQKLYFDEEMLVDSLHIKRVIEPYQNDSSLKILDIVIFNGKKKMASYKKIIITK